MSQIAACEIRVINRPVRRQSDPPRTRTRCRQNVFADFHRAGVNTGQLVGAELAKEGRPVLQDYDAVGHSVRRRRFDQGHLATFRIKTSDVVRLFVGEPQNTVRVEYGSVGVDLGSSRRTILGDLASLRVKFADVPSGDRCEPDVAVSIGDQSMRA